MQYVWQKTRTAHHKLIFTDALCRKLIELELFCKNVSQSKFQRTCSCNYGVHGSVKDWIWRGLNISKCQGFGKNKLINIDFFSPELLMYDWTKIVIQHFGLLFFLCQMLIYWILCVRCLDFWTQWNKPWTLGALRTKRVKSITVCMLRTLPEPIHDPHVDAPGGFY